jgi:hypothetical protein
VREPGNSLSVRIDFWFLGVIIPDLEMPLKIIHPDHTEVMGVGFVLLSSPHTMKRDLYTGQIVEEAALLSKSWAIVAKESKQLQGGDETQPDKADFDKSVQEFVEEYGIKCVIAIGGTGEPGIAIKSDSDEPKSEEILDIIKSGLEPHFSINNDPAQSEIRTSSARNNVGSDASSTRSVQIIHIELGPDERSFRKDQIVNTVADIVGLINARLGFSEGSGGALN